ncbi:DUF481 domain-containing protein [Maribacter cobaltidurans]|uniref:Uncharacterized protein n=1 Tax=Maribacter cobaltidurans TaxID=1178778 RepID=A0A223V7F7_9FLAO|nr:DUF481 domain-containing protein [Maribacter cobaltidurans]ASV31345.1 hypothetical protein CJ263_14600 [Maribacter cobaltidurans]GGD83038.1 hypothetical protein GCM10011412_21020 [Maribacter cobaltidurans]
MLKSTPVFFKHQFEKFTFLFIFLIPFMAISQGEQEEETQMRLFIDCNCDKNFLRQEIQYVGHVRDQAQANIKLFIYDISNGSGGRKYTLNFQGVGYYKDINGELTYDTTANMTSDEVRKGLLKKVQSGLLKYVIYSGLADNITYTVNRDGTGDVQEIDYTDPWNNWIFEVFGEARLDKESSRKNFSYTLGFESDHVTENWRIRTDVRVSQANSEYVQDEETFTSERFRYSVDGSIVRSLSDHWSTGVFGGARHDTFTNLDFRYYFTPALEYNIFPYREVLRREITLAYKIGYFHNDYIETTILDKLREGIFNHSLDFQVRYRQPWGSVYTRLRGSTFLNDFSKNRIQFNGNLSVRLLKGLSVRFSGRFELIRDQINLPAGDASIEDVLLQQKQIATDFETGFNIGLSYTFGSAFNNIINTRL